jgi:hypothetical protein
MDFFLFFRISSLHGGWSALFILPSTKVRGEHEVLPAVNDQASGRKRGVGLETTPRRHARKERRTRADPVDSYSAALLAFFFGGRPIGSLPAGAFGGKPELAPDLVVVVVHWHQYAHRPETDYSGRHHGCEEVCVVPVVIAHADLDVEPTVARLA